MPRWRWLLALALILGCVPVPAVTEPLCVPSYEALLVLFDLSAGARPSRLKEITRPPDRQSLSYTVSGRSYRADLYRPATVPGAAILLVPGAARMGKDDPRLVALANTLARAKFAVLVPDMAGVRELRVRPSDVREVADAFNYLVSRRDLAPEGRAGIAATSYAVGPAILAALEPDVRDRVRFVQGVGGYYDMTDTVTFFTTGYFREGPGKPWRHREPNPYGKLVFLISNADRLPESDRTLLTAMAQRRIADPRASLEDLASRLGPEGRSIYQLLDNADPHRVPELIEALPAPIREDMAALDLSHRDLRPLKARLILVHGKDDDIIPYTESVRLDRALPKNQARLFLINGLHHVDIKGMGWMDGWRMACAVEALLAEQRLGPP